MNEGVACCETHVDCAVVSRRSYFVVVVAKSFYRFSVAIGMWVGERLLAKS
jgi:hypothetical protein